MYAASLKGRLLSPNKAPRCLFLGSLVLMRTGTNCTRTGFFFRISSSKPAHLLYIWYRSEACQVRLLATFGTVKLDVDLPRPAAVDVLLHRRIGCSGVTVFPN